MKVLLWHERRKIIKLFIIGLDILTQYALGERRRLTASKYPINPTKCEQTQGKVILGKAEHREENSVVFLPSAALSL